MNTNEVQAALDAVIANDCIEARVICAEVNSPRALNRAVQYIRSALSATCIDCDDEQAAADTALDPLDWRVFAEEGGANVIVKACLTAGGPTVRLVYDQEVDTVRVSYCGNGIELEVASRECPLLDACREWALSRF